MRTRRTNLRGYMKGMFYATARRCLEINQTVVDCHCRFKAEMWSKVAEEMAIPWRAAEAMHWQLGEQEMARRAGVVPFSLSSTAIDPPAPRTRRASTSLARPRKGSTSRPIPPPPQLPSVEELTAGVPAFAPHPTFPAPREPYRLGRPLDLGGHSGHLGPNLGLPPRTLP